ncbi:hypothetical protein BDV29DRAFT_186918 [Aspergillus leporis]|uniref:Uncharacterized protein n=1 Tax=Aspergillus leporis TaxID=41062 RepID=A0A5N5WHA0_9EURO|nr:hypothetical protein BDV29DRAFT_186918 [Aspergillus leporis]
MLLVFQSCVHQNPQDLDLLFRLNALPFDGKGLLFQFIGLRGEVYDGGFLRLESRSAPPFPVDCLFDDRLNSFPVASGGWPGHPCGKIIHESCYEFEVSSEGSEGSFSPLDVSSPEISTKAIAPPWLSICLCTKSALKKRNRIGSLLYTLPYSPYSVRRPVI